MDDGVIYRLSSIVHRPETVSVGQTDVQLAQLLR